MSGIVGLFRRDGGSVQDHDVRNMLATITHRGPDASAVWTGGAAGLGNCMLLTTAESLHEQLPRVASQGPWVIAADARIDNRDELKSTLGLGCYGDILTDSDLILHSYARWGERCPEHLIGDFSFAIWDHREQKLFCARDSAGIRSFYYFASRNLVAFGSEIKAIIALAEVPAILNEQKVGDYLINLFEDLSITFYKDIFRLPPASTLTVTPDRLEIKTYWRLDPSREIRLRDDGEYTDAFREIFDEAVKCRVRSAFPIGSTLSGGLDSSAIACSARNLLRALDPRAKLHTFSIVFPGAPEQERRALDERSYIDCVLETGNFDAHFIRGDQLSPMTANALVHHHLDEANFAPNLYLHWAMYKSARENGVRVFLDGLDGDTTVSHGFEYLRELAETFRWRQLHREGSMLAQNLFQGSTARRVLWKNCFRDMAPIWMHAMWRLLHGRFREVRGNTTLAHPDFARRIALRSRAQSLLKTKRPRTARESHHKALTYPLYAQAMEMADKTSSAFGIEARYPFFDRRLMEFCLAVPADRKLAMGWNRVTFRRAMEGVLPVEIQWRPSKGNLSSNFHRKLLEFEEKTLEEIVSNGAESIGPWVDLPAMQRALTSYKAAPFALGGKHSMELFAAANLALWLKQSGLQPDAAPKSVQSSGRAAAIQTYDPDALKSANG